ncbi:hypothetical protein LAG90_00320 [Marinilongibacter aquaticus]|uniref:cyclophilin-like fold protein n=1 Tax=Marinilongibacter aquaticus TaxID=2975157 RepID=UPI0021BD78FC|nr:cyclophilin-like fold protein [Marinilongibacter aquaticus]UBM59104.1 hypothetical protein LAG90_00320 [Marinilongibacter aquaticus]
MEEGIAIDIFVGTKRFAGLLFENQTAESLLAQMPFETKLEDYAGNEQIFYPATALHTEGALSGAKAQKGDIMYYAPWGDVALFYKDFRFAAGLIPLGRVQDIDALLRALPTTDSTVLFEIKR